LAVGDNPIQPPPPDQEYVFNGNFEKWFAKDEYIQRPKLVEIDDKNRIPDDTVRIRKRNLEKKKEEVK
jgi:hypothetical protein